MTRILKNKYLYLLFIIPFILSLLNKSINTDLSEIKKCNQLDYEQAILLHPNNFSPFEIYISFMNEKKWYSNQFKNRKTYLKNTYYSNKNKNKAEIIISISKNIKCSLSVSIKPHGDGDDHHIPFNLLPSLQVKIKDGHIFGITNFLLLKPKTRVSIDSEIFATAIIKELDLLAPRTTRAIINYNDTKQNYIFQEKIVKEFIEINNFKEGEIIAFDDRFNYKKDIATINNSQYRLVNDKWAKKNNILSFRDNIAALNAVRHYHPYANANGGNDDLYSTAKRLNLAFMFEQLPKFSAIMIAINADHGLSIDDRRFYFDSLINRYMPIYYDGMSNLLFQNEIYKPVIHSALIGVIDALNSFDKINKNEFIKKLKLLGINNTDEAITLILKKIKNNLIEIQNLNEKDILKTANKPIIHKKSLNNIVYAFKHNSLSNYEICDELFSNCYLSEIDSELYYRLVSQELKIKGKDVVFISSTKKEYINNSWAIKIRENINDYKNNEFKYNNNQFFILTYGEINLNFNEKLNELFISKNNTKARVIILNGKIDNLKINLIDNTNLESNTDDFLNITGCLTFYNMRLSKLSINIQNSKCEDSLNIIRSKGNIDNINIEKAISDALDLDFSEIEINNLYVQNSLDDCLDVSFGNYKINNLFLNNCLDKGISSEYSSMEIQNAVIKNTDMAIVSKDYSIIKIKNASVSRSKYCVNAYNKKQEFSGGEVKIISLKCVDGLVANDKLSLISIGD